MHQVQFLSMRLTQSVVSVVQTVNMRPADESSQSCSYRWMVSEVLPVPQLFKTKLRYDKKITFDKRDVRQHLWKHSWRS